MTDKKFIECNQDIALYWKNLEKANFCYECFAEIMDGEKYEIDKSEVKK